MADLPLAGKRVLIREDFNVPVSGGVVTSDARLGAALPTVELALQREARVLLMSHLGRPREGEYDEAFSLRPVARRLAELLGRPVPLVDPLAAAEAGPSAESVEVAPGEVALLENVRFRRGEKADDPALAAQFAALCDIYVMDAFGSAHRAHASTHGVARLAPVACAGPLLVQELAALALALERPAPPTLAIVGGSKVSTKLGVLEALAGKVDELILGGGIANTLLAAAGHPVGRSLHEPGMASFARQLLRGEFGAAKIPLPSDVVVAESLDETVRGSVRDVDRVQAHEMILDIGPATAAACARRIEAAGTILWNGPVGVFEHPEFARGTEAICRAVAASAAFSVAGGGDTLAAIQRFGVREGVSCLSTGGGAFLEFIEGRKLPAVAMLEARAATASPSSPAAASR